MTYPGDKVVGLLPSWNCWAPLHPPIDDVGFFQFLCFEFISVLHAIDRFDVQYVPTSYVYGNVESAP